MSGQAVFELWFIGIIVFGLLGKYALDIWKEKN